MKISNDDEEALTHHHVSLYRCSLRLATDVVLWREVTTYWRNVNANRHDEDGFAAVSWTGVRYNDRWMEEYLLSALLHLIHVYEA